MSQLRLGFFASHGGTNMQAIIDAVNRGDLDATPAVIISNNRESEALKRARTEGIPSFHMSRATHPEPTDLDRAVLSVLRNHRVDYVILAGYMRMLGSETVSAYAGRILNVHPALLPRFGGRGMYGRLVHEAVIAANEHRSGATVHLADDEYDHGPILAQVEVPVIQADTPDSLAARVLVQEHALLVATLQRIRSGEVEPMVIWERRQVTGTGP